MITLLIHTKHIGLDVYQRELATMSAVLNNHIAFLTAVYAKEDFVNTTIREGHTALYNQS